MEPLLAVQSEAPELLSKINEDIPLEQDGPTFRDVFWSALHDVDNLQKDASKKISEAVTGDTSSFHEVILATEKAKLALQLLAQVQNKAIEAYHEVMRLQL
jgi:flagellar hook-basal body complex protein FliE